MTRRDRLMKGRPQRQPEAGGGSRAGFILARPSLVLMLERGEQPCVSSSKNGGGRQPTERQRCRYREYRPYPCTRCGKSFCYPSKLAAHQQIHVAAAAGRPYPCLQCSKSFRQLRNLTLHQRVHEDGEVGGDLSPSKGHSNGETP
ncbi:hypothetical protein lerEdw1_015112 [Lerista edwardsae]|nr:hypothetical protein lerEdw1_015112 [Lerista edwardsae]